MTLHNVLFVPDLIKNGARVTCLLSQRAAHTLENGAKPVFISSAYSFVIHYSTLATTSSNGTYWPTKSYSPCAAASSTSTEQKM